MIKRLFGRQKSAHIKNNEIQAYRNQPKVKIIAIAKDESAYFPEWLHHHQYFGFDAFDIYVNRTQDNSLQMLDALKSVIPNLSVYRADWVDRCPEEARNFIQFITYANAFEQAQQHQEFDYVMFLDIDEYWTPRDMQTTVQSCILQQKVADTISFGWLNEHGSAEPFTTIPPVPFGQMSPLVKTLIKVSASIDEVALHLPLCKDGKSIMVGGDTFISAPDNRECLHPDLVRLRDVMVIHRMFRSPLEYISMLARGRPSDSLALKLNRGGYNRASGDHQGFDLDEQGFERYHISRQQFLSNELLLQPTQIARGFVKSRAEITLDSITKMSIDDFPSLFDIFKGCDADTIEQVSTSIRNSPQIRESKDPQQLIKLASVMQNHDIEFAKQLMQKAASLS